MRLKAVLPLTDRNVALWISGKFFDLNPQKYNPESDEFTCLILRVRVELLHDMLNFPFWNPLKSVTLESQVFISAMSLALGLSDILNHQTRP